MIIIEKFDIKKYTLEKKSFALDIDVFNIGNGYGDVDCLGESYFYSSKSIAEIRKDIWIEIEQYLPRYKANPKSTKWYYKTKYLSGLIQITKAYKILGKVKLISTSELEKAELFKRVIEWLVTQI